MMRFPDIDKPSSSQKRLLKDLIIDETGPGTVLHDVEAFLSFLRERPAGATGSFQMPLRLLPEINMRLAQPLQLGLKRPMQKSYPHINGLYLLLRASGLVRIGGSSRKPTIVVDEEVSTSWQALNPTERYFTLFETWLLRAREQIINEQESTWFRLSHTFEGWAWFFFKVPAEGLLNSDDSEVVINFRYTPGWHHLALMELFGLVSVQHGISEPGQAWCIQSVRRTPLGDALLALLLTAFFSHYDVTHAFEDAGNVPFGALQPYLKPYFPAWKRNLSIPEWLFRPGTHVFKVSLGYLRRRIAIPGDQPLEELALAILDAVEFDHSHLFDFRYQNRFGIVERVNHPFLDEGPWTPEVLVGEVPLAVGHAMLFTYDYGDWWEFDVTLESVEPDTTIKNATVLESHGEAPEQYR